eukprot:5417257-Pleurochrysis_carterae.AAC.1
MARIRELAAGDAAVERLASAAFFAMAATTRSHTRLSSCPRHLGCRADQLRVARTLERHADDEHGRARRKCRGEQQRHACGRLSSSATS